MRFLTKRLEALTIVDRLPDDQTRVFFGAWVTLEDDDGVESRYRIVGPDEFNVGEGKISMDSPLARAMLKKQVDDEVVLKSEQGDKVFYITGIEYFS